MLRKASVISLASDAIVSDIASNIEQPFAHSRCQHPFSIFLATLKRALATIHTVPS